MTIREMVHEIQVEMRDADLQPERAAQILSRLTGLLASVNVEIRQADAAYSGVLLKHLDGEEAANRARIRAETTPEYQRKREAKDTKEFVVEAIRSLKYVLRSAEEEMRLSR
jgi:hypothetical protein